MFPRPRKPVNSKRRINGQSDWAGMPRLVKTGQAQVPNLKFV